VVVPELRATEGASSAIQKPTQFADAHLEVQLPNLVAVIQVDRTAAAFDDRRHMSSPEFSRALSQRHPGAPERLLIPR
jgi:hypothetical protein